MILRDQPTPETTKRMKGIRTKETSIEKKMLEILKSQRIKVRKQPKIKGIRTRPDFRINGTKVLIFCDSSFWHGRRKTDRNGDSFNRNKDFWSEKLKANRERDIKNTKKLIDMGWEVHRFWDTDIEKKSWKVKRRLEKIKMSHKLMGFSAVDLFSGVGSVTHGLIKAGIPVNAGIDNDPSCKYAYEKNNKTLFLEKDVTKIDGEFIKKLYPKGDLKILVGCAPCQPFSKHTQKIKNRENDEKWGLLYSFSRIIEDVLPEIVSMENVPNIVKEKVYKDFKETLQEYGYKIFEKIVYCPDYGVPQKRRRLVLLASRLGNIELLPRTHNPDQYVKVSDTINNLEKIKDGQISRKDKLHRSSILSEMNKKRIRQSKPGGTWMDWEPELLCPCHKKKTGKSYSSVYGRMKWEDMSPTITTQFYIYGTGRFGHPVLNRALSLREGALLQTFPRYYDFINPKSILSIKKLGIHIGNAVPFKLAKIIGKSIVNHLDDMDVSERKILYDSKSERY